MHVFRIFGFLIFLLARVRDADQERTIYTYIVQVEDPAGAKLKTKPGYRGIKNKTNFDHVGLDITCW